MTLMTVSQKKMLQVKVCRGVESRESHQPQHFVIPAPARHNHMSPYCRTERDAIRWGFGVLCSGSVKYLCSGSVKEERRPSWDGRQRCQEGSWTVSFPISSLSQSATVICYWCWQFTHNLTTDGPLAPDRPIYNTVLRAAGTDLEFETHNRGYFRSRRLLQFWQCHFQEDIRKWEVCDTSFVFIKHSSTNRILGGCYGTNDQARLTQIFELLMTEINSKIYKDCWKFPLVCSETIVTLISQDLIMRPTSTTYCTSWMYKKFTRLSSFKGKQLSPGCTYYTSVYHYHD